MKACNYCKKEKPLCDFQYTLAGKEKTGATCNLCRPRKHRFCQKYQKTEKGKSTIASNRRSNSGYITANQSRYNATKLKDPALNLIRRLRCGIWDLRQGRVQTCSSVFQYTQFKCHEDVLSRLGTNAAGHCQHRIPVAMYDHLDVNEVLKCWSFENMFAGPQSENLQQHFKIVDSHALAVPVAKWPKQWNGTLPTPEDRARVYEELRAVRE